MAEGKIGIIRAVFRYFRFWNWNKARGLIKAADGRFPDSVDGIAAAFDIQKDKMVKEYLGLRDTIAELEAVLEDKRARLEALKREKEELLMKREGALAMAEEAQKGNDSQKYETHCRAFERFQARIEEIEDTREERLRGEITDMSNTMDKYMLRLKDLQSRIEKISQQKAEAIADFVSAKQVIELNGRLQGLESSLDSGPIAAVLEANKRLTAKARISEKLSRADVHLQDKEYEKPLREPTTVKKGMPGETTPGADFFGTTFISFDGANRSAAVRLASNLRADGIEVWLDEEEFEPGDNVDDTIIKAINKCAVFIPLISRETRNIQSNRGKLKYHCREWEWAYANMKAGHNPRTIIPVKIDGSDWMYDKFENLYFISVKGGDRVDGYEELKEKLLKLQK
jgi:hypothetical protein